MKSQLIQLTSTGAFLIPCPAGYAVRVALICAPCTAGGFEQGRCVFTHGSDILWQGATNQLTNTTTFHSWSVGGCLNAANIAVIDPVTGAVTMDNATAFFTAPLPNLWWPFEVAVTLSPVTGTAFLQYDLQRLD